MSWYQENKFAATVMGATAFVSGVLVYIGMGFNSEADLAKRQEQRSVNEIDRLQSASLYPSAVNKEQLAREVEAFASEAKGFQEELLKYRPKVMAKLTQNEFSGEVTAFHRYLQDYYKEKGISLSKGASVYFGMEEYAKVTASESSTKLLNYQLKALKSLFKSLADSGIESLENVHRPQAAEAIIAKKGKSKSNSKRSKKRSRAKTVSSVYDGLPIEVTFTGSEASMQEFFKSLVNNDDYFFTVKQFMVRNEKQERVSISKSTLAEKAELAAMEFDDPGSKQKVNTKKEILKQVTGNENVTVFMLIELVLFHEASEVEIPGLAMNKQAEIKGAKKRETQ